MILEASLVFMIKIRKRQPVPSLTTGGDDLTEPLCEDKNVSLS